MAFWILDEGLPRQRHRGASRSHCCAPIWIGGDRKRGGGGAVNHGEGRLRSANDVLIFLAGMGTTTGCGFYLAREEILAGTTCKGKKLKRSQQSAIIKYMKAKLLGLLLVFALLLPFRALTFTPHVDAGDFVVVVNAEKVVVTGKKETNKVYMSYSQYPGKEKRRTVKQVRATHPEKLIEHAVKGMIPHNRLGRAMITKLKVYAGAVHPHVAQQPEAITL